MKFRKNSGFTIVELLIVITVIAILATLVITAYNGVQQKARNTQRVTAAREWQKLLTVYVTSYGKYPANIIVGTQGTSGVCLGDGYPTNWDSVPNQDCFATTNIKHGSSTWDNQLKLVSPTLPRFSKTPVTAEDGSLRLGIAVRADSDGVDGVAYYPMLMYYLEGSKQDCGLRPVINAFSRDTTGNGAYSTYDDKLTVCEIKLPDPAKL